MLNIIERASKYKKRTAIKSKGNEYTYADLLSASKSVASKLLDNRKDLNETRVAFLISPGFDYVQIQWGIWRAGGIAVPLCTKHPLPSISYVLDDTTAETVIYSKDFKELLSPLIQKSQSKFIALESIQPNDCSLPDVETARRAMILYTSGTTGNPKGVVTTHQNIESQITSLTTSWQWNKDDHILNVLPLHHIHGILNVTLCALWSGACCEFLAKYNDKVIFDIFCKNEVNVFMAVPTIYFKLISYWESLDSFDQEWVSKALKRFRLMVSGSAALPITVLEKWRDISGHTLLERYGMTEMGMAISNPYVGERKPGHIGQALPNVTVRIADESDQSLPDGTAGEIQVKGPNVFKEYWQNPGATTDTFTNEGWFKTGDFGIYENGSYRILGRNSVDIIKSGGYKISALEIEEVLRAHPAIKECGVVGLPDDEWGEIIGACLVLDESTINLDLLTEWLKERLPRYQLPRKYIFEKELPRNVMGKVTKKELKKMF